MNLREKAEALLSGRRCAVLGFGISNRPLVDFLLLHGASVTVCDQKEGSELDGAEEFSRRGVLFSAGKNKL